MPANQTVRILLVDDYEPWCQYVGCMFREHSDFEIVCTVSNGLDAVQKAHDLQPELILLDIGLPGVNGIEAARRIRQQVPDSKILFVSENRSVDIAEEALRTGAGGYVVKSDAANDLVPAAKAVVKGQRFVSATLAGHFLVATTLSTTQLSWMAMLILAIR